MKVKELVKWLASQDQDATVEVVVHSCGTGYYDQGGSARAVAFDHEKHANYSDRSRTMLLGDMDGNNA